MNTSRKEVLSMESVESYMEIVLVHLSLPRTSSNTVIRFFANISALWSVMES